MRVGIDPDTAQEIREGAKGPGPMVVRYLRERCLLVADSKVGGADLLRAFRDCGSVELAGVIALLCQQRLTVVPPQRDLVPLANLETEKQIESWKDVVDLVILAQYRHDYIDRGSKPVPPEIATLREILNSRAADAVSRLWDLHVAKGTSRERVWRERFSTLATHTRRVHIIDGYAASSLARSLRSSRRSGESGAEWFLGHMANSHVEVVRLAASARYLRNDGHKPAEVTRQIIEWFDAIGSSTKLSIHLVEGNFDHGRRLAFEGWVGFDLHKGLSSFDGAQVSENMSLSASSSLGAEIVRQMNFLVHSSDQGMSGP